MFVGALIGNAASELFIPFFRFTGEQGVPLPPLLPVFAEQQVLIHKALGASLSGATEPERYTGGGPGALTNGVRGTFAFNDGN